MKMLRNPLAVARNHGSAKSGVEHWWAQRFSAIVLIPLTLWLVWAMAVLAGADHAAARDWLAAPWNAGMAILAIAAIFYHARLGLQVVIEDYVAHRPLEMGLQIIVGIGALAGAVVSIVSVLIVALSG
ncbi:MAG: succinate dehydrogenase, hydrophobic membrane anchor protein [Wenzhouxiangellaceae bacterium]|nr:succinate dehydrogenase, hydrophobic membrane anchor protein [Wenzhouxiangellaceae bacterium]